MINYVLIVVTFIVLCIGAIRVMKRIKRKKQSPSPYIDALHLLLEGKKDEALDQLKRTVKTDTENIMAYIQLGNLFREKGFPIRAAKIHRNLLVRGELSDREISSILYHLVLDYKSSNNLDRAIEMAERLTNRAKKNIEHQQLLLSLYEEKGEWDKALFYQQSINKWRRKKNQNVLALYKVHSGLVFTKKGAEREGRIRFREAMKLNKKCIPAYLYLGDSYRREGRDNNAYHVWREFTQINPEGAHLAFQRLRDVLYALGKFSEIEEIYQCVIEKKPKAPNAALNLAELYKKQGKLDQALDLCRTILEAHPESSEGRYLLVQLLVEKGEKSQALEEALQILNGTIAQESLFHCSQCGFESKEPLWHCPQCRQWDTFLTEKKQ